MPKERKKSLCMDTLRHAEYYGMLQTFDDLYAKSKSGEKFPHLMELILSQDNIMLAYRNIKSNTGSYTAGTDHQNIGDIGKLPPSVVIEKVRKIVTGSQHGYRPKPVRRKDIPKPNGKTRPLGIPCIWDRLIQQCIKQILEPICEAKFSNNSYGFRPNRSVEHAISRTYSLLQRAHLHYVLEFDIKGFFDNVNHSKLIRQLWSLGIQDKQLLFVIKRILKAPIRMPDGTTEYPTKGTPQGGIISPLLANVVLNELDHWIDSQWVEHPLAVSHAYRRIIRTSEVIDKSKGYVMMRRTGLKEMFIVRYADDFRIFCRNREDAERTMASVTQWITERLHLEVSPEKTRIVNVRKRYSEFLGFKIRVFRKGEKYVVRSHICDKKLQLEERKLVEQAKHIANPTEGKSQPAEIGLFDEMVLGMQSKQDPDFYLKHNFEKADSPHGCPYVQANCDLQTPSDNILVYGHNMKDGTMFSDLLQYKRESFWEQHRIIRFDTLTAQAEYTVMAVFRGEAEDLFAYYQFADAETPQEFAAYVDACKNAALYETGVTAAYGDKLLTLSTCDDSGKNSRVVVVAKRTSEPR